MSSDCYITRYLFHIFVIRASGAGERAEGFDIATFNIVMFDNVTFHIVMVIIVTF